MPQKSDDVVIGVDFGTLSGRAVVVCARGPAELGTAVHPYVHAVVQGTLPATGKQLPPDWALQIPTVDRIAGPGLSTMGGRVS